MIESAAVATAELEALVSVLSQVGSVEDAAGGSDVVRVDQLAVLEQVKAAAAAAQARLTAAFVESQQDVAQAWRERARECSDRGDFDGWRAAREQARAASFTDEPRPEDTGAGRRSRPCRSGLSGVAAQVALARRESPVQGAAHVRLAVALTRELPHTLAALTAGAVSEWRAQIIVRETATVTSEQRTLIDAEIFAPGREVVAGWGDRELARQVRAIAYRIDAASVVARAAKAEAERRVTIRPAPDTMAYLSALLPVAQAVAAHAALAAAADTARAGGDPRGKGQVMADTLVTRLTGQATAGAVPVEVQLVMTDRALLAGEDTPAQLTGYGTVPAGWARTLLTPTGEGAGDESGEQGSDEQSADEQSAREQGSGEQGSGEQGSGEQGAGERGAGERGGAARVWLRRLYTHPGTGALVAMDSHRRTFTGGLRRYLLTRDAGTCRTPWCDAPARHVDHVRDHADGGPTSDTNGQGLCVRCNLTKQLPGFTAITAITAITAPPDPTRQPGAPPGQPHTVVTTTPTGHRYTSHAPPLLPGLLRAEMLLPASGDPDPDLDGREPPGPDRPCPSRLEQALELALAA